MQPLCKIKAYFRLVFSQKTDHFTRLVNNWGIKVVFCISEAEFASISRLFSFVTHGQTVLKRVGKYLIFRTLFWNCV